jgi:hypothetical protein
MTYMLMPIVDKPYTLSAAAAASVWYALTCQRLSQGLVKWCLPLYFLCLHSRRVFPRAKIGRFAGYQLLCRGTFLVVKNQLWAGSDY